MAEQRDQETGSSAASSLTGWVALRLSLHLRVCNEGSHHPGPAQQITRKAAQHFARSGHSGASATAGSARGALRLGSQGRSAGAVAGPVSEARPRATRPARCGPRRAARAAPRGAARARGSGAGLVSVQPIIEHHQQRPRRLVAAGWPGEGAGLPFVLSSSAPRAPPPALGRPGPPQPGAGAAGELVGGCRLQAAARRPSKMAARGARPPPAPSLFTRKRKNQPPDTRPVQGLTLDKPFPFSVARFPYPCFLPVS